MNLAEALDAALPELPTEVIARKKYRFNPDAVVREEVDENGDLTAIIYVPEHGWMLRMPKSQYDLLLLFDGGRSQEEVIEAFRQQTGMVLPPEDLKGLIANAEEGGLWYQSSQERNITLSQKLADERRKRIKQKGRYADLSHVAFPGWDPDRYLNWIYKRVRFVFTPAFSLFTVVLFGFMTWIWIDRWADIGRDTFLYYTFTEKTGGDIAEFWVLFLILAFLHESSHGVACKHYGGSVHKMGFQLLYLAPTFCVEVTELWVRAGRWQRLVAIMAGIWVETLICAIATIIWWGTPPGTYVHDISYKFMLITGIIMLIMNVNPLIKLDGYFALAEIIGVADLKEKSTVYVASWVKRHIFGLPVAVDYVPPRRRWLYVAYALLSGAYSYTLLFAVSRLSYNLVRRFSPEWAFIPAALLAWRIFRSRIYRLAAFLRTVYVDKKEKLMHRIGPAQLAIIAALALVALCLPVFRRTSTSNFMVEPFERAVIRTHVSGLVNAVYVDEGSSVAVGTRLAQMSNLSLESAVQRDEVRMQVARSNELRAELAALPLGPPQNELRTSQQISDTSVAEMRGLTAVSPIAGTVVTPRVHDLEGRYISEGSPLLEIDDSRIVKMRLYLPESEVRYVRVGSVVALRLNGLWKTYYGKVATIASERSDLAEGLPRETRYKGLKEPNFFVVMVQLPNPGKIFPGMTGEAKILQGHRSLMQITAENVWEFVRGKLW